MLNLQPTQADYDELIRQMPAAAERLKIIIMGRMLAEKDAQIAELNEREWPEEQLEREVKTAREKMETAEKAPVAE